MMFFLPNVTTALYQRFSNTIYSIYSTFSPGQDTGLASPASHLRLKCKNFLFGPFRLVRFYHATKAIALRDPLPLYKLLTFLDEFHPKSWSE